MNAQERKHLAARAALVGFGVEFTGGDALFTGSGEVWSVLEEQADSIVMLAEVAYRNGVRDVRAMEAMLGGEDLDVPVPLEEVRLARAARASLDDGA